MDGCKGWRSLYIFQHRFRNGELERQTDAGYQGVGILTRTSEEEECGGVVPK